MTNLGNRAEGEYDFVLVLSELADLTPQAEDALFEAGCDDATISMRSGRIYLTFSRGATSYKDAVLSAIRDVQNAGIGAHVLRVDYRNLVSQADIARRIKRSRQMVHQFITGDRGPGNFPAPSCQLTDDAPLWDWCEVAHWLGQNNIIPASDVREAREAAAINAILEMKHRERHEPELVDEVCRAFATS